MVKSLARAFLLRGVVLAVAGMAFAANSHVIVFGKWNTVAWSPGMGEGKPISLKVRPLVIDGRVKEYVAGPAHEITDRLLVARRAFRVNDNLPDETAAPHWQWQRGGWLLVDRVTGHVSSINLPDFDAYYSAASWYRDYVAYCGISDDGKKLYAIVEQLGRRKPVLKKALAGAAPAEDATPDSACSPPSWERSPMRVSFIGPDGKQTFAVRGHVVDQVNDADEDGEEGTK